MSLLLPYRETTAHGPNFSRPPPELIDGKGEYQVEHIMGHWKTGHTKKLQYLVKWLEYPDSNNVTAGMGGTLELYLVPLVLLRQS
jgi:hypothetical protein